MRERGLAVDDDLSYLREFEHITLAKLLIARYESEGEIRPVDEAMGLLASLLKAAEAGERTGSVIEILAAAGACSPGARATSLLLSCRWSVP